MKKNDLISRSALKRYIQENGMVYANKLDEFPAVDAVEVGSCDGCYWKEIGRQQKCSCCRRNRHMKDNYRRADDG